MTAIRFYFSVVENEFCNGYLFYKLFTAVVFETHWILEFVSRYNVPSSAWVVAHWSTLHNVLREYVDSHGDRHQQRHNDQHEHDQVVGVLEIRLVSENVSQS